MKPCQRKYNQDSVHYVKKGGTESMLPRMCVTVTDSSDTEGTECKVRNTGTWLPPYSVQIPDHAVHNQNVSSLLSEKFLETPSQTYPEVCLLYDLNLVQSAIKINCLSSCQIAPVSASRITSRNIFYGENFPCD